MPLLPRLMTLANLRFYNLEKEEKKRKRSKFLSHNGFIRRGPIKYVPLHFLIISQISDRARVE